MLEYIYLCAVIIITLCIMYLYYGQVSNYNKEMEKIKMIEQKNNQKQKLIDYARSLSTPCQIPNLTDPKSCYINSNYQCTWNEVGERCDKKI